MDDKRGGKTGKKTSAANAQQTHPVCVTKTNQLIFYRKIIAVSSETHTKNINAFCRHNIEFVSLHLMTHEVTTGL
jgi:hypothetical protein